MRKSDKHPFLSGKQEMLSRHLVQVVLPAFGTLYFALSPSLGLPASEQVVGGCAALATFFGTVLGVNNRRVPESGEIEMEEDEDGYQRVKRMSLETTPEELSKMREVKFKVQRP
jgi:hypothetical protein